MTGLGPVGLNAFEANGSSNVIPAKAGIQRRENFSHPKKFLPQLNVDEASSALTSKTHRP
jgi:hypothetical protein